MYKRYSLRARFAEHKTATFPRHNCDLCSSTSPSAMFSKRHLSSFFIGLVLAVILLSAHESKAISLGVRSLDNFEAPSTVASRSHLAARQDEGDDDSGGDDDDDDDNTPTTGKSHAMRNKLLLFPPLTDKS